MKLAYLAPHQAIHTVRWVNALAARKHTVTLFTMHPGTEPLDHRIRLIKLPFMAPWGYFLNATFLKQQLTKLAPDLLHVHYASGYGTLGRLTGFRPQMLSTWGSDLFNFPQRSPLHYWALVRNLQTADLLGSTSQIMTDKIHQLCPHKTVVQIPFGVDIHRFYPRPELRNPNLLTIGTVKTLAPVYGIDILIEAFAQLRQQLQGDPLAKKLRLAIAGQGPQQAKLQALVTQLELNEVTEFSGYLPHAQVPDYLNRLDIYVAASRSESFGVAILEASACALPVVVSDTGGLPEVVKDNLTGYLVPKEQVAQFAEKLRQLVQTPTLRTALGEAGRQWVIDHFQWPICVDLMEQAYFSLFSSAVLTGP